MSDDTWQRTDNNATSEPRARRAFFDGVVYNEAGERAEVVYVAGIAHYAVPDQGFLRHVLASRVDDAVIADIGSQVESNKTDVTHGILAMLGKDDLFTKAAVDSSIRNLGEQLRKSDPSQWVPWLKLFGFRIVVDVHGNVVEIVYPASVSED